MMTNRSRLRAALSAFFTLLSLLSLTAEVIPVDLPARGDQPVAKDKPVKVFILSGQSNMLGFGKVEGAPPLYSSVFLSADPSVKPCKMPHGIYQVADPGEAKGATASVYPAPADPKLGAQPPAGVKAAKVEQIALGTVSANLPAIEGDHMVYVDAYLDVSYDGSYEVHAGMGSSSS